MEKFLRQTLAKLAWFIANPYTFLVAFVVTILWLFEGYYEHFSFKWIAISGLVLQFFTFLVVFVVEFSEETETRAMQKKLDEIIKAFPQIKNEPIGEEKRLKGKE